MKHFTQDIWAFGYSPGYPLPMMDEDVYYSEGRLTAKDVGKNMRLGKFKGMVSYDGILRILVQIS